MKGGKAQVLYRDSSSLADTEILKKKKEKKNISNERNPLVAATQEFEEHECPRRDPRGGNCSMYVEKYVVSWVKLGTIRTSVFPLWRRFVTVVEDNLQGLLDRSLILGI